VIADAINGAFVRLYTFVKREDGQTFVEYSLIGLLVAVALVGTLGLMTGKVDAALNAIKGAFGTVGS
jgi:Flp pilus assembly pilin Flp